MRLILFVRLADGLELSEDLIKEIKTAVRQNLTLRHVPAKVIAVGDIPYAINGKKVELAVRDMIHNKQVLNVDALANPESLAFFKYVEELRS